ncbi:hypothetical protein AAMO2058_000141000 [Amorphochlora amoebiformis]
MVPLEQDARMVLNAVFESLFGPNFQRVAMRKLICVTIQVKERNFASASKSRNTVLCQHPSQRDKFGLASNQRDKFALASKSRNTTLSQHPTSIQVKKHNFASASKEHLYRQWANENKRPKRARTRVKVDQLTRTLVHVIPERWR